MLHELAKSVRAREVSAVELVARALDRIERHNHELNAVVALRAEEALREAADLDARLAAGASAGGSAGAPAGAPGNAPASRSAAASTSAGGALEAENLPLAGIPFLVKDNMDLTGMPTTQGSLVLADSAPAARDSLTVARLRAAGAIPVGRSNVPEFCFEGFTANRLFGITRNPWATEWSPGGSSGGSAAAMAAGMIPFGTATDGGGSIRIPASFCGLYGIKPTNGVIARDPLPFWIDFSTDGPLALGMDDLRLLLAVMAGPNAGDPTALPVSLIGHGGGRRQLRRRQAGDDPVDDPAKRNARATRLGAALPSLRPSTVYAAPRFVDWGELPDSVGQLFEAALRSLECDLGLRVEPIEPARILPTGGGTSANNADDDWFFTAACEQAHCFGREWLEANGDRLSDPFAAAMHEGLKVTLEDYLAMRRRRFDYVRELDELLGDDKVIVTPTMPSEGFFADGRVPGRARPGTDSDSYNTQVQNLTGHPALSVPAGVSPNGVPFGLQVTGPRFRDELVLAIGDAWEQAHPGPRVAPGYEQFWPL